VFVIYPRVAIIILNWNGWKDTIECLESLYQITYPNYSVILVDNGSEDDSLKQIRDYSAGEIKVESSFFDYNLKNKPIKIIEYSREEAEPYNYTIDEIESIPSNQKLILIKNEKNYGFAEGNNIGIRFSFKVLNPKYILLLNNDTVVDKSFLDALVMKAETDTFSGFIGPKIYYYNFNNRKDIISQCGGEIDFWKGESQHIGDKEIDFGQYEKECDVDYITGACLFFRSSLIMEIGLLNASYFLYWEEADWCQRGKRAGYKIKYDPHAKIWHKGGQSSSNSIFEYYNARNRIWFEKDNAPFLPYSFFLIYFFGYKMWRIFFSRLLFNNNPKLVVPFMKGVKDGFLMSHPTININDPLGK
jgi:GT2 family glycosyltransferase